MSSMIDAISKQLTNTTLRMSCRVGDLQSVQSNRWSVRIDQHDQAELYDGLIIALPAPAAARVVSSINAKLSTELAGIEHASSAVVVLGYEKEQVRRPMNAFGCVVPAVQNRSILAISSSDPRPRMVNSASRFRFCGSPPSTSRIQYPSDPTT